MDDRIAILRRILDESSYTVALCGSGMMEEGGFVGVKYADKAYDIEKKYGHSPEEIFTSAFYHTRPKQFFDFYKEELKRELEAFMMAFRYGNNLFPDKTARCYKEYDGPDIERSDEERRMMKKAGAYSMFMDKNRPPRALLGEMEEED